MVHSTILDELQKHMSIAVVGFAPLSLDHPRRFLLITTSVSSGRSVMMMPTCPRVEVLLRFLRSEFSMALAKK